MQEDEGGVYSGIGATLTQNLDTKVITFVKIFKGSPAEEAGIKSGDILYKVDGTEVTDMELDLVVRTYIRGQEGTDVDLTVVRSGEPQELLMWRNMTM